MFYEVEVLPKSHRRLCWQSSAKLDPLLCVPKREILGCQDRVNYGLEHFEKSPILDAPSCPTFFCGLPPFFSGLEILAQDVDLLAITCQPIKWIVISYSQQIEFSLVYCIWNHLRATPDSDSSSEQPLYLEYRLLISRLSVWSTPSRRINSCCETILSIF